MQIIQIMRVITCIIYIFYASNASNASNTSNYSHYLHVFMWVMWVITCINWSIHDICIIWNFKYFELNNKVMWVMRGGFEASISAMQVFESRQGRSSLARQRYASIWEYSNISNIFLIFKHAYRKICQEIKKNIFIVLGLVCYDMKQQQQ